MKAILSKAILENVYKYKKLSIAQIAKIYHSSYITIRNYLIEYDIPIKKIGRYGTKYHCNEKFFEIPNPINSYFAGFIAADGCIYKPKEGQRYLRIAIDIKDIEVLENFKQHINYDGPIKLNPREKAGYSEKDILCVIRISSDKICNDLERNFNITERKTHTLQHPKDLDHNNSISFICGIIDGDGCIYVQENKIPRISITCTVSLANWIQNIIGGLHDYTYKLTISKHPKTESCRIITFSSYRPCLSLYNTMLKLQLPGLTRKWNKIKMFKEKRGFV